MTRGLSHRSTPPNVSPPPIGEPGRTGLLRRTLSVGRPLSLWGRLGILFGVLFLIGGFSVAAALTPSPAGLGTHQQLGLPPCSIRILYGVPCPNCGMTTSFAHFVRGELPSSARANPAGLLLAFVCAFLIPWGFASVWCGRLIGVRRPTVPLLWITSAMMALSFAQWAVRVWT